MISNPNHVQNLYARFLFENYLSKTLSFSMPSYHPLAFISPYSAFQLSKSLQSVQNSYNTNNALKNESLVQVKLEETIIKKEETSIGPVQHPIVHINDAQIYINKILDFLVKNIGKVKPAKLRIDAEKIHENIDGIKEIFEGLLSKFLISTKTKEEKIKFVLRKSFKFMREKLMQENGIDIHSENDNATKKKVEKLFFDCYFKGENQETWSISDSNDLKDFIMPFRKKSKNKTMNNDFLKKIFSDPKFLHDYTLFLKKFHSISEQDNNEKSLKTSKKIAELMPTRQYKEFSQKYFKRMPWLDIWVLEAEKIAIKLIESFSKEAKMLEEKDLAGDEIRKKVKIEPVSFVTQAETETSSRNRSKSI